MKERVFPEFVFHDSDLSGFEAAVMFGRWFMDSLGDEKCLNRLVTEKFYVGRKFAWIGRRGFRDDNFEVSKLGEFSNGR